MATSLVAQWTQRGLGSTLSVIAIRGFSVIASLAYVKVYTGVLSSVEVGSFFYLATLSYALNALVFVPVDFYMQARISRLCTLPLPGLRHLVVRIVLLSIVPCLALTLPLIWLGKLQFADVPVLFAAAALLYVCSTIRGIINNRGGSVFVSSLLLFESVARLGAFVLTTTLIGGSARSLVASSAVALAVELAILLKVASKKLPFDDAPGPLDTPGTILRAAAPIAGAAVCNTLQLQTYRVIYPLTGMAATSGIYGVVANIGAAAMVAAGSILSQIQTPLLYSSQGASIGRFVRLVLALTAFILLPAIFFSEFLVRLLTKQEYVPYAFAVAFGVITEACNLIMGGYTVLLSIQNRTGILLKFNLLAAAVSVGGCFAMLSLWPGNPFLIGIPIVVSQVLLTVSMVALIRSQKRKLT